MPKQFYRRGPDHRAGAPVTFLDDAGNAAEETYEEATGQDESALGEMQEGAEEAGEAIGESAEEAGEEMAESAEETGDAIEDSYEENTN